MRLQMYLTSFCVTEHDAVVSVFESKMNRLHTTHSWDFLGIDSVYQYNQLPLVSQSNVIVGVVDGGMPPSSFCDLHTRVILQIYILFLFPYLILFAYFAGVWPESESFCDEGLGPVPKNFKGECITGENFTLANCNR